MNYELIKKCKNEIVESGKLLWDKNLAYGYNGNISMRLDEGNVLLTAHDTCLGKLTEDDIVLLTLNGKVPEGKKVSTGYLLHTEVYKNFKDINTVIHTHCTFTNAFFSVNKKLTPSIFEARMYLGDIEGIDQATPAVTDVNPVIAALKNKNTAVLRNHGTVAIGKELFECFMLIQSLEEAVKVDAISRIYAGYEDKKEKPKQEFASIAVENQKVYELFSKEQIDEIARLVNSDKQMQELGEKTKMTMDLGIVLNETGIAYSFHFENGKIINVGNDKNAEFLISAPWDVWRAVFKREIDPFVATTQKKMDLRGDFAKISKWYAPCSRIFELWAQVPVK